MVEDDVFPPQERTQRTETAARRALTVRFGFPFCGDMRMTSFRLRIVAQVLPFLFLTPGLALAQAQPTRAEATAAVNPAAANYSPQQIDQMVAPIALYPDQLLTQVLMAATYPPQIVEAAQWLQDPANAALKGDALVAALQPLAWDPSVKALVAFPQVVVMLSEHIEWTQTLGVAFASQQAEIMTRVQALRQLAVKSGHIKQLRHLVVREEGPVIVIAPAEPNVVFVPVYNPMIVYGEWRERTFPPVFLAPSPRFVLETIEPGIQISVGYGIVAPLWGWSRPDWRGNRITINRVEYTRITQNVVLAPGDGWRRNGPVVLVEPAVAARLHTTVSVPAGTVAPSAAAAVVSLPKRAASEPALIQTQKAGSQPEAAKPAQAQTTPAKPGTAQPGQAQTTPAKPRTPHPGQARATTDKPGTAQPAEKKAATTPAEPAQPGHAQAPASQTGKAPGTAAAPAANQMREHAAAPSAAKPADPTAKPAPEHAAVKPPAGTPAPGAAATAGHVPKKAAPEAVGQGTSTPPKVATPPGRSEELDQKDR